jgi:hypothetical protein
VVAQAAPEVGGECPFPMKGSVSAEAVVTAEKDDEQERRSRLPLRHSGSRLGRLAPRGRWLAPHETRQRPDDFRNRFSARLIANKQLGAGAAPFATPPARPAARERAPEREARKS